MDLPNPNNLPDHIYSVHRQEVVERILEAITYEVTCVEFGIQAVWERASPQAKLIWDRLKDELAAKGYITTFPILSGGIARTRISW